MRNKNIEKKWMSQNHGIHFLLNRYSAYETVNLLLITVVVPAELVAITL